MEGNYLTEPPAASTAAPSLLSQASSPGVRLGVIAVDPLRAIGLGAILEDTLACTIHTVALEALDQERALAALVIDAAADDAEQWPLVRAVSTLHPELPVLVLGEELSSDEIREVHAAGARGYLSNMAHESEIRDCFTTVLSGSTWPPRLSTALDGQEARTTGGVPAEERRVPLRERLTPRECEVMNLLLDGRSNRDIAAAMRIDEATVKAHLGRMLRKSGCSNRVELTLMAVAEKP